MTRFIIPLVATGLSWFAVAEPVCVSTSRPNAEALVKQLAVEHSAAKDVGQELVTGQITTEQFGENSTLRESITMVSGAYVLPDDDAIQTWLAEVNGKPVICAKLSEVVQPLATQGSFDE
ncbi:hypothetical protein IC617_08120 [Neiella sp. HB171785]|uniref:Uncharacterized protein n=1 Tax=Neiella litorisoli TaxID=2771431 RepID=A0A8J6QRJ8_9GAMM|nr:hypothetical protein [Neiella litorisoli]MBD1389389.1 hypothetical protein [Neiella litorisoli]